MGRRTARLLGGVGRASITLGVLLVLFALFQLWGTSLAEQRAQDDLEDTFTARRAALLDTSTATPTTGSTTTPPTTTPATATTAAPTTTTTTAPAPARPVVAPELADELLPELGETVGRIVMPTIGVDKYVVEGVRRADLRRGPGHYPDSPLPGQAGNAAIAGHRTTYGAPFGDLDDLRPGDEIVVETLQGTFHYEVMGHPDGRGGEVGHVIVSPDAVEVLDDFGDDRLTLTACHPKYSAAQRIVVTARLVTPPAPAIDPPEQVAAGAEEPAAPTTTAPEPADGDQGDAGAGPGGGDQDDAGTIAADGGGGGDAEDPFGESLGWDTSEVPATAGWGALTAALAVAVALAGRRWRRWPAWLLGSPFVGVSLFVTFGHLDRLLPAL